jgi:hypothetical protein
LLPSCCSFDGDRAELSQRSLAARTNQIDQILIGLKEFCGLVQRLHPDFVVFSIGRIALSRRRRFFVQDKKIFSIRLGDEALTLISPRTPVALIAITLPLIS